jgi:hypothetical protein
MPCNFFLPYSFKLSLFRRCNFLCNFLFGINSRLFVKLFLRIVDNDVQFAKAFIGFVVFLL